MSGRARFDSSNLEAVVVIKHDFSLSRGFGEVAGHDAKTFLLKIKVHVAKSILLEAFFEVGGAGGEEAGGHVASMSFRIQSMLRNAHHPPRWTVGIVLVQFGYSTTGSISSILYTVPEGGNNSRLLCYNDSQYKTRKSGREG